MIKKLCQRHCPVQPGCSNFKIIRIFSSNNVIHSLNMTTPGWTVTVWPDEIVTGEVILVLGQIWLVAIVRMEYTNQVLLPRLKIFSSVSKILNLQLALISVAVPRNSDPRQSWMRFVLRMERPSQKNVCPRHPHPAKSEDESVWKVSVSPYTIAHRKISLVTVRNYEMQKVHRKQTKRNKSKGLDRKNIAEYCSFHQL